MYKNKKIAIFIIFIMTLSMTSQFANGMVEVFTATPTNAKVLVNGVETSFDAYLINDNNYFKLRDLAYIVSGTSKQFEVTWDSANKAINMISGLPYTIVGGEMALPSSQSQYAISNGSPIYKDGVLIDLKAYTINDNNYFKLRDLAKAFDIGVFWNGDSKTVEIDTAYKYMDDGSRILSENFQTDGQASQSQEAEGQGKSVNGVSFYPVIKEEETNYPNELTSVEDFEKVLIYMAANQVESVTFNFNTLDEALIQSLYEMYTEAGSNVEGKYAEYFSDISQYGFSYSYTSQSGSLVLSLYSMIGSFEERAASYVYFEEEADKILTDLIEDSEISSDMTQYEVAKVLYEWMALNLSYDQSFATLSYTGYGAIKNSTAVCQGYTALYNYLCKRLGIEITGVVGFANGIGTGYEAHIWSKAIIDNETVYIDSTFGDPVPDKKGYCNFAYFDITKEDLQETHKWVSE